jgi:hypothetical protein
VVDGRRAGQERRRGVAAWGRTGSVKLSWDAEEVPKSILTSSIAPESNQT